MDYKKQSQEQICLRKLPEEAEEEVYTHPEGDRDDDDDAVSRTLHDFLSHK